MNVGERIRQLRSERNLTQPQLAQAIGIEQSYLSKLENDKSVPSADIFQAILKAFSIDVARFLEGVDAKIVHGDLRQIPEVANLLNANAARRIHDIRKWLFGSAAACVLGLTCIVAGDRGLMFSNMRWHYVSPGVVWPGEPMNIYESYRAILYVDQVEGKITPQVREVAIANYAARADEWVLMFSDFRGPAYVEEVPGGRRYYHYRSKSEQLRSVNRWLMLLGTLLTFGGIFGFIVEYRLRRMSP